MHMQRVDHQCTITTTGPELIFAAQYILLDGLPLTTTH